MNAGIIIIGDEILIGQVVDTNTSWMAKELNKVGVKTDAVYTVGDNGQQISEAIQKSLSQSDLVLMTGGLGPTKDDITKKVICEQFGCGMHIDESVLANVKDILGRRGIEMTENNVSQAMVPDVAKVLSNEVGTAPGLLFEKDGKYLVSMPGVPFEMRYLIENRVIPFLMENNKLRPIYHKTIIVTGIAESILATKLTDWEDSLRKEVKLAYLPAFSLVRLRLSVYEPTDELVEYVSKKVEELYRIIPENILGEEDIPVEVQIGNILREKGMTVATAESCTGGKISSIITSVAGSSDYFKGTVVSYANEIKMNVLGVSEENLKNYGAVSSQVVEQMATGVRKLMNTDFAVSTSGVAGPGGGSAEKPVGTVWIGVATPEKVFSTKYVFSRDRSINIDRASATALTLLLKELKKI